MSDILPMHKRLRAAGLSDAQSKVFLQLVADSEAGRFDEQAAVDQLRESWLGLFGQVFRLDRWSVCRVQAAAICGSRVK